jgi:hypothetical protein
MYSPFLGLVNKITEMAMAEDGQEWMHGPTLTGQFSRNPFTPANLPGGFTRGLPLPGLLLGLALEITDHLRAIHGFVSTK